MVHTAGAEPVTLLPWPDIDALDSHQVAERMTFADAVLLPGGGDIDPAWYGQAVGSEHVYDVDRQQDAVDLAIARWALEAGKPLLAVCRGLHVANVALGGSLEQHMEQPHREVVHNEVRHTVDGPSHQWPEGVEVPASFEVSCFHHQRISRLAIGLLPLAQATDGTVEAVTRDAADGWFLGVQWHPEDMPTDAVQRHLVEEFVRAARERLEG
jgi:putative glutamine amidotransferase